MELAVKQFKKALNSHPTQEARTTFSGLTIWTRKLGSTLSRKRVAAYSGLLMRSYATKSPGRKTALARVEIIRFVYCLCSIVWRGWLSFLLVRS